MELQIFSATSSLSLHKAYLTSLADDNSSGYIWGYDNNSITHLTLFRLKNSLDKPRRTE